MVILHMLAGEKENAWRVGEVPVEPAAALERGVASGDEPPDLAAGATR